jgi:hypothetical protein
MLVHYTDNLNNANNGFFRKFKSNRIKLVGITELDGRFNEICGTTKDRIFLSGNKPGEIYSSDLNFANHSVINLNLPLISNLSPLFYTIVDYPNIYILGGNMKGIIASNLVARGFSIHPIKTGPFGAAIILGKNSFIVRGIDTTNLQAGFRKITFVRDSSFVLPESGLSERLADAGLTYDGTLSYDSQHAMLFYVSRYCNRVISFDSNLSGMYTGHTIDTANSPNARIIFTKTSVTYAVPPITINLSNSAYAGMLFVQSGLRADNEQLKHFNRNAVIDIYKNYNCMYQYSFYLPLPEGERLKRFRIFNGDLLLALFEKHMAIYKLAIK